MEQPLGSGFSVPRNNVKKRNKSPYHHGASLLEGFSHLYVSHNALNIVRFQQILVIVEDRYGG